MQILFIQHDNLNTMTSPKFLFYLTCLFFVKVAQTTDPKLSSSLHQESSFVSAKTGDNFTLRCFYESDVASRFYWYKQTLGQKPKLISTFYKYETNGIFHDEFKNDPRFTLDTETEGTLVDVERSGLNVPATVHQSSSESIQPGGSVTLNCTVHSGTCDGEHSVYWFKNSEESQPGLIYTHGGRNDQCERKPNTQTHTCVYKLPMKSLNLSHAGTYYCAVASCGHILFGDGTKLELEDEVDLVYFLSGALAFTTILSVLLAFLMCMMNNRNRCLCAESQARLSECSKTKMNASKTQRDDTWSECVYFSVKQ
ncbi:uncharacterized protein LOC144514963 isoform X2 [Sander vitreus]